MTWREVQLGDYIRIKHGFAFKGEFFGESGSHVLLTPGNCYPRGGLRLKGEKEKYYVGDIPDDYILKTGDLIVVMTDLVNSAPILGGAFLIPEDDRYLHNQRLGLVEVQQGDVLDKDFLYYLLNSDSYRAQVRGSASGATVRHTAPERIYRVRVRVPANVTEQKEIAQRLRSYDDLIANNTHRIELLEKSARLLFEEWFVRLRYPGHEHDKIVDGLTQGWRRVGLAEITTKIGSGATPRGGETAYLSEGITLIRSQNVYDFNFTDDGLAYINEDQAQRLANVEVERFDILLNITGASVGRCCMVPARHLPARVNQHVMIIRADPLRVNPYFLLCAMNSDERKRQLLSYAHVGATREALTKELISRFEILLPNGRTLHAFGEVARDLFVQGELLQEQNAKLLTARDLLLPRLMDGRIEV
jgi:type I restriction enzyme S subunit